MSGVATPDNCQKSLTSYRYALRQRLLLTRSSTGVDEGSLRHGLRRHPSMHEEGGSRARRHRRGDSAARGDRHGPQRPRNRTPGRRWRLAQGAPRCLCRQESVGRAASARIATASSPEPCCERRSAQPCFPTFPLRSSTVQRCGTSICQSCTSPDWTAGPAGVRPVSSNIEGFWPRTRRGWSTVSWSCRPPDRSSKSVPGAMWSTRWSWQTACSTAARRHWISSQQRRSRATVGPTPSPRASSSGSPTDGSRVLARAAQRTSSGPSGCRGSSRSTRFSTRVGESLPGWTSRLRRWGSSWSSMAASSTRDSQARSLEEVAPRGTAPRGAHLLPHGVGLCSDHLGRSRASRTSRPPHPCGHRLPSYDRWVSATGQAVPTVVRRCNP